MDCDGDDSDKDRDYVPSDEASEDSDDSLNNVHPHVCADEVILNETERAKPPRSDLSKKLKRKRQRNPSTWKSNVRKTAHDSGKEYISVRKKVVPAKRIKTVKDCQTKCMYKCQQLITEDERKHIFEHYYTLNEHGKRLFLLATSKQFSAERRRKNKNSDNSRRKKTFTYHFQIGSENIQVCKMFYLGTLAISQTPVYTAHSNKDIFSNIPKTPTQGKHIKYKIPEEDVNFVKVHIDSFPTVESHYCRANTQRKYLEPSLNIKKMYSLYTELCTASNKPPVKESFYRNIFCNEFNLHFHVPKKDRCDLCEEMKIKLQEDNLLGAEQKTIFDRHLEEKNASRIEKNRDRENRNTFLVFDLQNVLSCPHAEVSNFYYKSKLNVYNLTALLSSTKQVYCALWNESLMGRSGNDIASALLKILEAVFKDNRDLTSLILWSDSCVPQNRNSLMSSAIALFMRRNPNIESIVMKFSTPGHSCNQEIDAVHSCIERVLKKSEYYSPLSLIRLLLKVSSRNPYRVIQLKEVDFVDYKSYAIQFNYKIVPFSQVVALKFSKSIFEIEYKVSHANNEWKKVSIRDYRPSRTNSAKKQIKEPVRSSITKSLLPQNKVEAIKSMFKWMPEVDKAYYVAILPKSCNT